MEGFYLMAGWECPLGSKENIAHYAGRAEARASRRQLRSFRQQFRPFASFVLRNRAMDSMIHRVWHFISLLFLRPGGDLRVSSSCLTQTNLIRAIPRADFKTADSSQA